MNTFELSNFGNLGFGEKRKIFNNKNFNQIESISNKPTDEIMNIEGGDGINGNSLTTRAKVLNALAKRPENNPQQLLHRVTVGDSGLSIAQTLGLQNTTEITESAIGKIILSCCTKHITETAMEPFILMQPEFQNVDIPPNSFSVLDNGMIVLFGPNTESRKMLNYSLPVANGEVLILNPETYKIARKTLLAADFEYMPESLDDLLKRMGAQENKIKNNANAFSGLNILDQSLTNNDTFQESAAIGIRYNNPALQQLSDRDIIAGHMYTEHIEQNIDWLGINNKLQNTLIENNSEQNLTPDQQKILQLCQNLPLDRLKLISLLQENTPEKLLEMANTMKAVAEEIEKTVDVLVIDTDAASSIRREFTYGYYDL